MLNVGRCSSAVVVPGASRSVHAGPAACFEGSNARALAAGHGMHTFWSCRGKDGRKTQDARHFSSVEGRVLGLVRRECDCQVARVCQGLTSTYNKARQGRDGASVRGLKEVKTARPCKIYPPQPGRINVVLT